MPSPQTEWKVLPHGQWVTLDANLMTIEGTIPMPVGQLPRRMTVVRLRDGKLVIFSAIALEEASMKTLEAFGTPAFMVVPNGIHRLDSRIYRQRYPDLRVVTPPGARDRVEKVVVVDSTNPDFGDPQVSFLCVPGTREEEGALRVEGPRGTTLVLNDVIGNLRGMSGVAGLFLRAVRFAGDRPRLPLPVKLSLIRDKAAFRDQLISWSRLPNLRRILVAHGAPIEGDPSGALRVLADELPH